MEPLLTRFTDACTEPRLGRLDCRGTALGDVGSQQSEQGSSVLGVDIDVSLYFDRFRELVVVVVAEPNPLVVRVDPFGFRCCVLATDAAAVLVLTGVAVQYFVDIDRLDGVDSWHPWNAERFVNIVWCCLDKFAVVADHI